MKFTVQRYCRLVFVPIRTVYWRVHLFVMIESINGNMVLTSRNYSIQINNINGKWNSTWFWIGKKNIRIDDWAQCSQIRTTLMMKRLNSTNWRKHTAPIVYPCIRAVISSIQRNKMQSHFGDILRQFKSMFISFFVVVFFSNGFSFKWFDRISLVNLNKWMQLTQWTNIIGKSSYIK